MANPETSRNRLSPEQREALRKQRRESRASATYREFLKDLRARGFDSDEAAEQAAGAVLCALEYRLTSDESWNLESQLPLKVRQLLSRCELHEDLLPRAIHKPEFLRLVAQGLGAGESQALHAVRAVFETIASHVTAGEVLKLIHQLPPDLRELWPAWARAGEEYRTSVLRALPGESPTGGAPRESMTGVVEQFLELPLRAQFAALRALTPWVLVRLTDEERQEFLAGLERELADFDDALSGSKPPTLAS